MLGGGADIVLNAEGLEENDAALLIREPLRMHEGHVEEASELIVEMAVEASREGAFGSLACFLVRCEGAWRVPEQVTWKLIEEDQEGERPFGRRLEMR